MSIEPIKAEVRGLLAQVNYDVQQAERTLTVGSGQQKVTAASHLISLRRQQTEFEDRLRELEQSPDGFFSTVVQWFKEDWMLVIQRLEAWAEGRS
jgi:hypothetical protein